MPATGCGIGLRAPHVAELVERRPAVGWLEVHAENYMGGGPAIRTLLALRHDYPISLHGVGLSLGSPDDGNDRHLERLARLVERVEPVLISEHLAWSVADGRYLNHLLPLPYTPEALALLIDRIARVQDRLGRRLLVENPSGYLRFRESPIPEAEFLDELARRTGCGLLCDVNNIYVTCANLGGSAEQWLDALTPSAVAEIHLAGHVVNDADGTRLLIDDHGSAVTDDVWRLYERALGRFGAVPTLVEWDTELPALDVLLAEADKAQRRLAAANADAAAA
ncbi:MAG TPA: DUF692 domain-containing protein [Methylomirabilota bacterium]|jgi:uncharacterized protein (UPF0276 family)|nr:DUF692 domain-containing protein [Methylomirabilota bacterium]